MHPSPSRLHLSPLGHISSYGCLWNRATGVPLTCPGLSQGRSTDNFYPEEHLSSHLSDSEVNQGEGNRRDEERESNGRVENEEALEFSQVIKFYRISISPKFNKNKTKEKSCIGIQIAKSEQNVTKDICTKKHDHKTQKRKPHGKSIISQKARKFWQRTRTETKTKMSGIRTDVGKDG
ncbi:hypothetical protein RRG08_013003 [Elysia crispata]|uniref:Uncharacterized protein n=1 Tax=Elysia crispata TaxID=231223 RepID=A0AAE1A0L9_9GAST|nr:hypothetical protein RRG08_013003 [Elysia crispata]